MLPATRLTLFGLLVLSSLASATAADLDWSGWLGPERNGWVAGFQVPDQWPAELRQDWEIEVGTGYGSPLVADGKVYQHARQGEDEVLWCVDLTTGKQLWRSSHPVPFQMGGGGEWHGKGPKSSPVLANGRLFTMSIAGVLSAWNAADGKLLWRNEAAAQFSKPHPYWGASTSPIVDRDRVIVHVGCDDEGELIALDVSTGTKAWGLGKDGPSYSSPLLGEFHGVRQIVEWNHRALVGVEAQSGKLLWEYPFPHEGTNQNMPTPAVVKGRVLVGGENRGLHCVQPVLDGAAWSVREIWHQDKVALDMSSAVVNEDLFFGFSHYGKGRLFCVDLESGRVRWQGPGRAGQNATFLAIPGHMVVLLDNGQLKVIAATAEEYTEVASYTVSELPTWAPPVLLNDALLIKDQTRLVRWALPRP